METSESSAVGRAGNHRWKDLAPALTTYLVRDRDRDGPPPKLLTQVRMGIRARHYSPRTEKAYVGWIKRYILFHGKRHPKEMGEREITEFVSWLASLTARCNRRPRWGRRIWEEPRRGARLSGQSLG